jgi:beta-carotene 3-hydroxylase
MSASWTNAAIWVPVALVVAPLMDRWAAFLHGRVWHGWLYPVHRTHHDPRRAGSRLEANDALSAIHAPIAMVLIIGACRAAPSVGREVAFGVGVGMTLFGGAYFIVHDGLVHGRLPVSFLLRVRYFRSVARCHRVHHRGSAQGAPYGLFFGKRELALHRPTTPSRRAPARDRGPSARPSSRSARG